MTHAVVVALSVLGVGGQVLAGAAVVAALLAAVGVRRPLRALQRLVWGYELWLVFLISATATGGSLFFSLVVGYAPCDLCWYERICIYPLSIVTLLAALANDQRVARYLLPLPLVGAGISVYHVLLEYGVVAQTQACLVSAPGGCATKWIDEFGFVTIPNLSLTAFALAFVFLVLASLDRQVPLDSRGER